MKSYANTQRALVAAVVVCSLVPGGRARAQEATSTMGFTDRSARSSVLDYLGIENFSCNCTFRSRPDDQGRLYVFRSEPVVTGVDPEGAAAGILMRGDVITKVNDISILSVDGEQAFSDIRPGDDVDFIVRRRGNVLKLSIAAGSAPPRAPRSPRTPRAAVVWSSAPAAPVAPTPRVMSVEPVEPVLAPTAPRPSRATTWATAVVPSVAASPRGWFGFSIRCNECGWASSGRPGESPVWESNQPPEVAMIAGGSPASRAGLKAGDRITHVDGVSILTADGRRRFGRVMPGQKVRLTVVRDGASSLTRELTLGTRPEIRAALAAVAAVTPRTPTTPLAPLTALTPIPPMRRELRYSGKLDDVTIEVFSAGGPTVEREGDTMVITVGASVVRLKVDSKGKK